MRQAILITNTSIYLNTNLPCLISRQQYVYIAKLEDIENKNEIFQLNDDIPDDVIVLGDVNRDSFLLLHMLQKLSRIKYIHLILVFSDKGKNMESLFYNILLDMKKIRTLTMYDPYEILQKTYENTESSMVKKVINVQMDHILNHLEELELKLQYQTDNSKYFYDQKTDCYIETDSLKILDNFKITSTLGFLINPDVFYRGKEENAYTIKCMSASVPRLDGKKICEQLRQIRKQFAKLNNLDFEFKECIYDGPCAGTCSVCDQEVKRLYDMASEKAEIQYPEVSLED